jgi:hypothetical protein
LNKISANSGNLGVHFKFRLQMSLDERNVFCVLDRMSSDFQPLDYADGRTVLTPNGSLVIQSVGPKDEGYYLCRATNGIGAGLSKVVSLAVNGKCNGTL